MSNIKNEPKIKNKIIMAVREQLEHRALWLYLLRDKAKNGGLTRTNFPVRRFEDADGYRERTL